MTTELWKMLIPAVVLVLTAAAGLIKVWTEIAKVKADRLASKETRDKDSLEIHDTILKHSFQLQQLKDAQSLTATVVDDLRDTCSQLNSNIVKLDTNVLNLTEVVKELRKG